MPKLIDIFEAKIYESKAAFFVDSEDTYIPCADKATADLAAKCLRANSNSPEDIYVRSANEVPNAAKDHVASKQVLTKSWIDRAMADADDMGEKEAYVGNLIIDMYED